MRAFTSQSAQYGLRVTPGAWRASASGVRLAQQTARHSRAGAFAQAIIERYKGRQIQWSSLDLVFTQRSPGMTVSPVYRAVHMHVAPRLNLTIRGETHRRHQRFSERVERALQEQLVHTVPGETHILHQRFSERVERTLREQLVHDLGLRGQRIAAVTTQGSRPVRGLSMGPSRGARTDLPLGRLVSTVVHRPGTAFTPDHRGLTAAPATTRLRAQEAAPAGADQVRAPLVPWTAPGEARLPLAPRRAAAIPQSPPVYRAVHMLHVAPRLHLTIRGETPIRHQRSIEPVERTLREQLVHELGLRGQHIEAMATPGRRPDQSVSMGPSRGASAELPLGRPVSTVVHRPGTAFTPDHRGLTAAPATTRLRAQEAAHAGADQVRAPLVPRTTPDEAQVPLAPRRGAVIPQSPPEAQGAIARLIEHTMQPGTLPGLELRLVSPDKQPSGARRPAAVAQEARQTPAAAPWPPPAPAAPSPPVLDINAIAPATTRPWAREAAHAGADQVLSPLVLRTAPDEAQLPLAPRRGAVIPQSPPVYRAVHMHVAPHLNLTIRGELPIRHQRFIQPVERTLREQFVHGLAIRGQRIEAMATPGRRPAQSVSMDPSRGASADLPLGWPAATGVRRPGTEFTPDHRGLTAAPATTRLRAQEAAPAGADQVRAPLVPRTTPDEAQFPLAPRRGAVIPQSPPEAQGAIARLIEHTMQPGTLPGLELRLVSPDKQPSGSHRPAAVAQEAWQTTAAAPWPPPAPVLPSPPVLDINAISAKVYDRLLRRQQLERARRGLY